MKSTSYKHLTYRERGIIENCLNQGNKLFEIANTLNRDPRGIKNEIYNKRQVSDKSAKGNVCVHRLSGLKSLKRMYGKKLCVQK